jgi:hypothetical protein
MLMSRARFSKVKRNRILFLERKLSFQIFSFSSAKGRVTPGALIKKR